MREISLKSFTRLDSGQGQVWIRGKPKGLDDWKCFPPVLVQKSQERRLARVERVECEGRHFLKQTFTAMEDDILYDWKEYVPLTRPDEPRPQFTVEGCEPTGEYRFYKKKVDGEWYCMTEQLYHCNGYSVWLIEEDWHIC